MAQVRVTNVGPIVRGLAGDDVLLLATISAVVFNLSAAVGVPLMTPVTGSRTRPGGRLKAVNPVGEPEPVIVNLNGVPTVAGAVSGSFVMLGRAVTKNVCDTDAALE